MVYLLLADATLVPSTPHHKAVNGKGPTSVPNVKKTTSRENDQKNTWINKVISNFLFRFHHDS